MYDDMNPSVILCSEELDESTTCDRNKRQESLTKQKRYQEKKKCQKPETKKRKKAQHMTREVTKATNLQIPLIPRIIQTVGMTTELAMNKEASYFPATSYQGKKIYSIPAT